MILNKEKKQTSYKTVRESRTTGKREEHDEAGRSPELTGLTLCRHQLAEHDRTQESTVES